MQDYLQSVAKRTSKDFMVLHDLNARKEHTMMAIRPTTARRLYYKQVAPSCWEVGHYNARFKWVTLAHKSTQYAAIAHIEQAAIKESEHGIEIHDQERN
jgi:hypothetical protein